MAEFNRIVRDGVDVRVAARVATKRAASHIGEAPEIAAPAGSIAPEPGVFRRSIRPMVKRLFHFLRPVLQPVMFRLRRYMNHPLQEQLTRIESQLQQQQLRATHERQLAELHGSIHQLTQLVGTLQPLGPGTLAAQLQRIEQYALASARRVAVSCGPSEVLVRTEVGFVLCPSSDHAVIGALLESGELETGTRLLIQRLLRPGDTFIDVGANLGLHTLAAAHTLRGRGQIIAFEPFEPTQRLLSKTIWMNGFSQMVRIHQAAVSSVAGTQELYVGHTSGHNSLYRLDDPGVANTPAVQVPVVGLDSQVAAGASVSLIKIDVEGAELDVLQSARRIVTENPAVALIVEFGRSHLHRVGQSTTDWLTAFEQHGFEYRAVDPQSGRLLAVSPPQLDATDSVNLLFARAGSSAWALAGGLP
jgi:FkbM family methyltransferase